MDHEQRERIRRAYDQTVLDFEAGRDPLAAVPIEFRGSPELQALLRECAGGCTGAGAQEIRDYLRPQPGMRLLDLGCCANLYNYRIDRWGPLYHGVDISPALIAAMRAFSARERIDVGALEVAEIVDLPFPPDYFDAALLIGVLEYVGLDYCCEALSELHRVLKIGARAVLDIPNLNHPLTATMFKLEHCLGRPNIPNDNAAFDALVRQQFEVTAADRAGVMLKYYLTKA